MTIKKSFLFILLGFSVLTASQAAATCSSATVDSVTLDPPSFNTGTLQVTTMAFTMAGALNVGATIAMRVPDFWGYPYSTNGEIYSGAAKYSSTATATLTLTTSAQFVLVTVDAGSVLRGQKINIHYGAQTCQAGNTVFRSYYMDSGCQSPLQMGTHAASAIAGSASFLGFETWELLPIMDSTASVRLEARDNCGNKVPAGQNIDVTFTTLEDLSNGSGFVLDTDAKVSTSSAFSNPESMKTITMGAADTNATMYYRIPSSAVNPAHYYSLKATYTITYPNSTWMTVRPISVGITSVSVDTGMISTNTTVTFSPDNNGVNDFAYINFTLPQSFGWEVQISSNNFNTFARRVWGYGQSARVTWDGWAEGFGGTPATIALPGTYKVRISVANGALKDESLTIMLNVAGIAGLVRESGTATPIGGAHIDVFGPTQRFGQSSPNGQFAVNGLQPGNYNIRVSKAGYGTKEMSLNVLASGQTSAGAIELDKVSQLHVSFTRPMAAYLPELWGNVTARTNDWSSHFYGGVHFSQNSSTSDAGDFYNSTLTTYTALSLLPGATYHLEVQMQGLNLSPTTVNVGAGVTLSTTIALQRRADISGYVILPATTSFGQWISVEAGIDANLDGIYDSFSPNSRFYGGVFINMGESSATYRIFGVSNGTYFLRASAQGFARSTASVVVAGGVDASVDFATFTTGGSLSGLITINGDTSSLDYDQDGDFELYVNAWSAVNGEGSNTQVILSTHPTLSTATYQLFGLSNGNYEVHMWLNGFEASPPGPKIGTITNGSGTLNLTFNKYSGALAGSVTLKNGATDFENVVLELKPLRNYAAAATTSLSTQAPNVSGQYLFTGLGTDFYTLRARYNTTGLVVEYGVQVINGSTTTRSVDLTADTYNISGRVTTSASAPYNDLSYVVNQTTPTHLFEMNGPGSFDWPANRIVAVKTRGREFNDPIMGGAMSNAVDRTITYFGTYTATTGEYTISNLSPGTYVLSNNGEMDGLTSNGPELAVVKRIVNIIDDDLTSEDFSLSDGFTISGDLKIETGESETGRNFQIVLKNAKRETVVSENVFLTGTSYPFTLRRVPAGSYVLTAIDSMMPIKYSVKDVPLEVAANLTGKDISLLRAAKIQGQLRIKNTGTLISSNNYSQILPSNFFIEARSNPWFPGGFSHANHPLIGNDGLFSLFANPGTYDVILRSEGYVGDSAISEGKKQFVPITLSGIEVVAGQVKDLGVIDMVEGIRVSGTVTDVNNNPLANIVVEARRSGSRDHEESLRAYTNNLGQYTIYGIDSENTRYYDIIAAPRPNTRDERYQFGFDGIQYGEVRKAQVDTQTTTTVNFKLEQALGSVTGVAVTPDSGALEIPFDEEGGAGAIVIMNKQGNVPQNNPLGDIEVNSNANGAFLIKGLAPGIYDLWILAKGYGSANVRGIVVGNSPVDLGNVSLLSGYKLFGTLLKSDGTAPSAEDVDVVLGIRNGFEEILVGSFSEDASGNISKYEISGFQSGRTYSVIAMFEDGEITVLAPAVSLTADTEQNFTIANSTPTAITQVSRNSSTGLLTVQFELSRSLRNSQIDLDNNGEPDDSEQDKLISLASGAGTLEFPDSWLSSDRKRIIVTYMPPAGESSFQLRFQGTFVSENAATGLNHALDQTFTFFTGIGRQKTSRVANANGGSLELEEDTSSISMPSGTFGDDADLLVEVTMSVADDTDEFSTSMVRANGRGAMANFSKYGVKAYPVGMAKAMNNLRSLAVDPFSSFYDIFLPAGISHSFPSGREAQMCLNYDSSVLDQDAHSLNIYYFNEATNEYVLENNNKLVDTENQRICVSLAHASIFTILNSTVSIINGGAYSGVLTAMNFPNPFNLKSKSITLQNPGSNSAAQTIDGTMIKISVPAGISGAVEIEIFAVTGELVRTLHSTTAGGEHFYIHWNGKNEEGENVASGGYFGRLTIGGGNEHFIKMAVIK